MMLTATTFSLLILVSGYSSVNGGADIALETILIEDFKNKEMCLSAGQTIVKAIHKSRGNVHTSVWSCVEK